MIDKRLFDCHMHPETPEMAPENILKIAREKGLSICMVDHVFKTESRIISDEIKQKARSNFPDVKFLHGCEADVYSPGKIALQEKDVPRMDFVMVSFTHVEQPSVLEGINIFNKVQLGSHFMKLFSAAIDYEHTNIIGHPFSFLLEGVDNWAVYNTISREDLIKQIRKAKSKDIAMDINARTLRMKDPRPQEAFIELANKEGCLFTIGSDAHSIEDIGNTKRAWYLVDRLGISLDRIIFPKSTR